MAELIIWTAKLYLALGVAVAVVFLVFGIGRLDPIARGAYVFRPLLIPGLALLWPLVLRRWRAGAR